MPTRQKYVMIAFFSLVFLNQAPYSLASLKKPALIPTSLTKVIQKQMKGFKVAEPQDFSEPILKAADSNKKNFINLQSWIKKDFNLDGRLDYLLLLVNRQTKKFAFYCFLRQKKEAWTPLLLSESSQLQANPPGIWRIMELKEKGEKGITERDYFCSDCSPSQKRTLQKEYINTPALETWKGDLIGSLPLKNVSSFAFCTEAYYLKNNKVQSINVCD